MQNLALWHISIAFPFLPNNEYYKNLAFERMNEQMSFYISEEGVVLENSAGYHKKGLELLDISFRYLTLLNKPIPYNWITKYDKAKDFYIQLKRPDGSLPVFGDTRRKEDAPSLLYKNIPQFKKDKTPHNSGENILKKSFTLLPVSGYSVWWDQLKEWPFKNRLSQTVVIWSNFPGHGHKHADEMSVLLWAYGQTWWTNIGYLPYGTSEREEAISWIGSNAPHLVGEHQTIKRVTVLKYAGNSPDIAAIDLERNVQNEYKIRRQVINLFPNIWITIDHSTGNKRPANTIWTTADNVNLQEGNNPGTFIFGPSDNRTLELHKYILGSKGIRVYQNNSNLNSNVGLESKKVAAASSIIIEQPAEESWSAVIWLIKNAQLGYSELSRQPVVKEWNGSENWQFLIPLPLDSIIVRREKARIILSSEEKDTNHKELKLKKYTEDAGRQRHIQLSFERAKQKYRKPDFSKSRRLKATYYLTGLLLLQMVASFFVKKVEQNYYYFFKIFSCLFWVGLIFFMQNFYF
jgi:hypothetical protein